MATQADSAAGASATSPVTLTLASASAARSATLRAAGVEPKVRVSGVDEDAVLAAAGGTSLSPAEAVLVLAQAKAEDVARHGEAAGSLVLGCDSLFELDGKALGKPRDADDAVDRWRRMSGRTGVLHTGHWLIDARGSQAARAQGRTVSTEVTFAAVTDDEIRAYVATGEPLGCAGAFAIDGYGGAFVAGLVGDYHNVVGLSLPVLRELLCRWGITWHQLWSITEQR